MQGTPLEDHSLKNRFDRDGYVVIQEFLTSQELAELQRELDRYITERVPQIPSSDVYFEDRLNPATLKQMARIKQHDSYFAELITSPKWKSLAETLLGDNVIEYELEWFNKPPGIGRPTPPHQDGFYFMLEPNEALTMWLALDPVDESNGCIRYIPGSHRHGLRLHGRTGTLGFSQGIVDYGDADREAEAPILAQPGDLLIHHALTIHRADGNPTERNRRSLGLIYHSAKARQDHQKLSEYQKQLNIELAASGKI